MAPRKTWERAYDVGFLRYIVRLYPRVLDDVNAMH